MKMTRNICPGDPLDIQCCVQSRPKQRQPGSRPSSSTLDSDDIRIPGIVPPHLRPDSYLVPDSSMWESQIQMETDGFYIQSQQPETPSSDERPALILDPLPNEDSLFIGDFPDEEIATSFADGSGLEPDFLADSFAAGPGNGPISDMDLPSMQSSEVLDDAQLAAYLLEEDEDQDPSLSRDYLGQG